MASLVVNPPSKMPWAVPAPTPAPAPVPAQVQRVQQVQQAAELRSKQNPMHGADSNVAKKPFQKLNPNAEAFQKALLDSWAIYEKIMSSSSTGDIMSSSSTGDTEPEEKEGSHSGSGGAPITPEDITEKYFQYLLKSLPKEADAQIPAKLYETLRDMPKMELHNHLTGSIPPLRMVDFAVSKKLYADLDECRFYRTDGTEDKIKVGKRIPAADLRNNPEKLEKFMKGMSVIGNSCYCSDLKSFKETLEQFFKVFAASDSLTDFWIMSLSLQLTASLEEAERQKTIYSEFMKGVWTPAVTVVGEAVEKDRKLIEAARKEKEFHETFRKDEEFNSPTILQTIKSKKITVDPNNANYMQILNILKCLEFITVPEYAAIFMEDRFGTCFEYLETAAHIQAYVKNYLKEATEARAIVCKTHPTVDYRFIAQVMRVGRSSSEFCVDIRAAFDLAQHKEEFVGMTIAGPEHHAYAFAHFGQQMLVINWLWHRMNRVSLSEFIKGAVVPPNAITKHTVKDLSGRIIGHEVALSTLPSNRIAKLTLHAGELNRDLILSVTSEAHLAETPHVEDSILFGHASRIGHANWMSSKEMVLLAERNVSIEMAPTTNELVLGVTAESRPWEELLKMGVDLSVNADDAAIARTNLTKDWYKVLRALSKQGLASWRTIKRILRATAEQSFLPGDSIYTKIPGGNYAINVKYNGQVGRPKNFLNSATVQILSTSKKAQMQWKFEEVLLKFEKDCQAEWKNVQLAAQAQTVPAMPKHIFLLPRAS